MNTVKFIAGDGTMWYLDGKPVRDDLPLSSLPLPTDMKMEPDVVEENDRQVPPPKTSEPSAAYDWSKVAEERATQLLDEYAEFVRLQEEEKQAAEKAAEKEAAEKEKEAAVADHQYVLQREAVQSRALHELQLAKLRDIDGSLQLIAFGVVGVNVLLATMLMRR